MTQPLPRARGFWITYRLWYAIVAVLAVDAAASLISLALRLWTRIEFGVWRFPC